MSLCPASSLRPPRTTRAPRLTNSSAVARPTPPEDARDENDLAHRLVGLTVGELRGVDDAEKCGRGARLEVRIGVRPAHDACAIDEEKGGDGDRMVRLARVLLE